MDERTQFINEQKEKEDLANEALDEACAYIQRKLGITTGDGKTILDFASHFFSDGIVVGLFQKYIDDEVYLNVLNKNQLIERLIKDDLHDDFEPIFITDILKNGFIGYQNQLIEDLRSELMQRLANR